MIKTGLVAVVSDRTGIDRTTVGAIFEASLEVIKVTMINGEDVFLRGFGTFQVKKQAMKPARDIGRGCVVNIPARCIPHFKPGAIFKQAVIDNVSAEGRKVMYW